MNGRALDAEILYATDGRAPRAAGRIAFTAAVDPAATLPRDNHIRVHVKAIEPRETALVLVELRVHVRGRANKWRRRMMTKVVAITACVLMSALSALYFSCAASAENLLTNADFKQGKPGDADFGWTVKLAGGENNECTVEGVTLPAEVVPTSYRAVPPGGQPGAAAIRIYQDELGASCISQEIKVQTWRWYVAEVWVNSEGMATFDFAPTLSLTGARSVPGGSFIYDTMIGGLQKGWRPLHVIAHSADQERITLTMGGGGHTVRVGGGWSGELLFSAPAVREVGLVEAAWYYPGVSDRHPPLYGPPINPERNEHGYAFQRGDVCRVAAGFPNPLYIIGRMDDKVAEGRVSLALPPGVRFRKHQDRKITPSVSQMPNGFQRVELPPGGNELVVDTDLEPGEDAVGYVQFEWKGGYQLPTPVRFKGIAVPDITAPMRAMVSLGIGGATVYHWDDDKGAMVRDLKRFGFNHLEIWGGDPRGFYKNGMYGITAPGPGGGPRVKDKNPEALAVTLDGKPCAEDLISPSYRGPALQPFIDRIKQTATMTSALTLDDENYSCSAQSAAICFHPRTIERWKEWVAEHEPALADVEPKVFARQPHKYRKHYDAWLRFRCELVAEMYGIFRDAFHEAVKESGAKTTERPMLGAYISNDPVYGLHSNAALAPVLDYVANMVYEDGDGVRKKVARLAPVTGKKLVIAISPGYQISPPGDARSQVLEAVMGGSQGVIAWGYYMGMDAGHLADIADAVRMFAPVEDIILDGTLQDGFTCDRDSVNVLARKLGDATVLLVSDYSPRPGRATLSAPGDEPVLVRDLYTGEEVAELSPRERGFQVELKRDLTARLYLLRAAEAN